MISGKVYGWLESNKNFLDEFRFLKIHTKNTCYIYFNMKKGSSKTYLVETIDDNPGQDFTGKQIKIFKPSLFL